MIAITASVIFFAPRIFFLGLTELFIVWGLYEFYLMAEKKGIRVSKGAGIGFAVLMPLSFCFPAEVSISLRLRGLPEFNSGCRLHAKLF